MFLDVIRDAVDAGLPLGPLDEVGDWYIERAWRGVCIHSDVSCERVTRRPLDAVRVSAAELSMSYDEAPEVCSCLSGSLAADLIGYAQAASMALALERLSDGDAVPKVVDAHDAVWCARDEHSDNAHSELFRTRAPAKAARLRAKYRPQGFNLDRGGYLVSHTGRWHVGIVDAVACYATHACFDRNRTLLQITVDDHGRFIDSHADATVILIEEPATLRHLETAFALWTPFADGPLNNAHEAYVAASLV